ncbi:MAG: hypothetical protein EP338_00940 [Bacteroidetes bacterium]|nr:MAG: hypothetical protein EP338_00940 [Bacteroidota bacterium]
MKQEISLVRSNERAARLFQEQLIKDFQRGSVELQLEEEQMSWEEIQDRVSEALLATMEAGEQKLLNLLYIIDLSESQFLSSLGNANLIGKLCDLVLFREAQKVYYRINYS